jgi:uracil-DNA glycosylase
VNRERRPPSADRFGTGPVDLRLAALREIIRLAEDDRRRGIRYWFDPDLAAVLRETVREVSGEGSTPGAPVVPPPREPARARPVAASPSSAGQVAPTTPHSPVLPIDAPPSRAFLLGGASADTSTGDARPRAVRPVWGAPPAATGRAADWRAQLEARGAEAAGCTACRLCETRHTVVFGTGLGEVPLVFVGEAPGHDEDLQGEPFVGRAGQLLTRIIEAIGLTRAQVYICNVLKCRPPQNRNPLPEEIASCRHFLESQLEILRPKVICTLGLFAAQLLLGSTLPIGKLRGRHFTEGRWPIVPTFHPAYLLRNPSAKAAVWEDVQIVRRVLDA